MAEQQQIRRHSPPARWKSQGFRYLPRAARYTMSRQVQNLHRIGDFSMIFSSTRQLFVWKQLGPHAKSLRSPGPGVGVVYMYFMHGIPFTIGHDVDCFDSEMRPIFFKIDRHVFQTSSNILLGLIYRMPDASVDKCNARITYVLHIINQEKSFFYLVGDLNIDFLKFESHKSTSTVLHISNSPSVLPLITKPTRVTKNTATLIDHILTNDLDITLEHEQGILCTDISDHYATVHIAGNKSHDNLKSWLRQDWYVI